MGMPMTEKNARNMKLYYIKRWAAKIHDFPALKALLKDRVDWETDFNPVSVLLSTMMQLGSWEE
eukprot:scaffold568_cov186-Chaetoceros_neogracile.AAC.6